MSTPPYRRLIGVGVGPGDPELVTRKAEQILGQADRILVPETRVRAKATGRAEEIVLAVAPHQADAIVRVPFSMSTTLDERLTTRDESADAVIAAFAEGAQTVALATIGDPNVFSTFTYLAHAVTAQLPDVVVETVPGITAMQALAAAAGRPLVIGDEVLALVPATAGMSRLDEALGMADTVVIYKSARQMGTVIEHVSATEKEAVVASDLTLPHEKLCSATGLDLSEWNGYFSTIMATRPHREEEQ